MRMEGMKSKLWRRCDCEVNRRSQLNAVLAMVVWIDTKTSSQESFFPERETFLRITSQTHRKGRLYRKISMYDLALPVSELTDKLSSGQIHDASCNFALLSAWNESSMLQSWLLILNKFGALSSIHWYYKFSSENNVFCGYIQTNLLSNQSLSSPTILKCRWRWRFSLPFYKQFLFKCHTKLTWFTQPPSQTWDTWILWATQQIFCMHVDVATQSNNLFSGYTVHSLVHCINLPLTPIRWHHDQIEDQIHSPKGNFSGWCCIYLLHFLCGWLECKTDAVILNWQWVM